MLGTYSGDVKMFNIHTGVEEASYQCHDDCIYHIECNKVGDLMLTSTAYRTPASALWSFGSFFDMKLAFNLEHYVEFSKQQDRIIGTQKDCSTVMKLLLL